MNLRNAVFLLAVAAIMTVAVAFTILTYEQSRLPPNTKTLPYRFSVAENSGVDIGTDIFRLGAISPGNGARRTLHLSDAFAPAGTQNVTLSARGQGSEWLTFEPAAGTLPLDVEISVQTPFDARYGVYEGVLLVTVTDG